MATQLASQWTVETRFSNQTHSLRFRKAILEDLAPVLYSSIGNPQEGAAAGEGSRPGYSRAPISTPLQVGTPAAEWG